jgi:CSLREA domain-containing protein
MVHHAALALSLACVLATPAWAGGGGGSIDVTTTLDGADPNPGDGVCNDGTGACTLRAAVQTANAVAGSNIVNLPAGVYELTLKRDADLPDAVTGDLDVTTVIDVVGAGHASGCDGFGCTVIDAKGGKDRAFDVSTEGELRLENLGVRNGKAAKGDFNPVQLDPEISGGLVRVAGQLETEDVVMERGSSPDDGGCIGFVDGASGTLETTVITDCKTKDGGGAVESDFADVELDRVTLARSKASDEGGGAEVSGGTFDVENATFSGNSGGEGGGIAAEDGAAVTINSSSFVNNKSKDGAAVQNDADSPATVEISNSLLRTAGKENNCSGTILSEGGNLENGTLCNFTFGGGDCPDCNPSVVEELADNGGPVPTHALNADSQAINNGENASCANTDARGAARVGDCDSGSFEFGGVVP